MKANGKKIVLVLEMAFQEGVEKYNGVIRYMSERKLNWSIRLDRLVKCLGAPTLSDVAEADGAIVSGGVSPGLVRAYVAAGMPLVGTDWRHPELAEDRKAFARVEADDKAIGQLAAKALHETVGTSAFAFFSLSDDVHWSKGRAAAFIAAARKLGAPVAVLSNSTFAGLCRQLRKLPKPAAIFAANDATAAYVLRAANAEGIPVPSDLAVLGVDNDWFTCRDAEPPLASIQPDFEQAGYLAAAALDRLLNGKRCPRRQLYPAKGVVLRKSLEPSGTAGRLIQRALALMDDAMPPVASVSDLAARLGVSRRLLVMRFRQVRSQGVLEALNEKRLARTCKLLRSTKMSVNDVCLASGLGSGTYPMRLFKKAYGMTMGEYRRRHRTG